MLITVSSCSFDPPPDPPDLTLTSGDSPVRIETVCTFTTGSESASPDTQGPEEPCVPLPRAVEVAFAPLPVLVDGKPDLPYDELALVACASDSQASQLGLVPVQLMPDGSSGLAVEDICQSLPTLDVDGTGETLADSAWASATDSLGKAFESCSRDLRSAPDGSSLTPVRGPETIGKPEVLVPIGVAIGEGLMKGWISKLTPEGKHGAGLVLLIVAAPIAGGVIAAGLGAAVTAGATIALVAIVKVGVQAIVEGTGKSKTLPSTAPSAPPQPAPSDAPSSAPKPPTDAPKPPTDAPQPAPKPSGGQKPAPDDNEMPDSCLDALVRAVSCIGQSDPCTDPELAAALAVARERECQTQKVLPDPDSEYCSVQAPTEEEIAAALVRLCAAAAVGEPEPGQPVCPLMQHASATTFASSIPQVCLTILGENGAVQCPQMGDPNASIPEPECPIGPVPEAGRCDGPPPAPPE